MPESAKQIYFPGLDGLRAIAALAVLFSHINLSLTSFGLLAFGSLDLAGFGVTIFFSLSGFLITFLLLKEKSQSIVNIPNFYVRRMLRIWPLYFLFIGLVFIFTDSKLNSTILYYVFFLPNVPFVLNFGFPALAHFWSLGIEEQFYLFWPWVIKRSTNLLLVISGFILIFTLLKIGVSIVYGGWSIPYTFLYTSRFGCMAIGALGAWFYFHECQKFARLSRSIFQLAAWAVLVFVGFNSFHIFSIIDHEIVALATVALIAGQVIPEKPIVNLELRPLKALGKISFGIYVYHPLVIDLVSRLDFLKQIEDSTRIFLVYGLISVLTILIAYISYRYFEQVFLRLKDQFTVLTNNKSWS